MTIEYVTDQSFDERVLNSALPVLLLFWRNEIEQEVGSALEAIASGYGSFVRVAQFKTDGQRTPTGYVRGVPELVLFKEDVEGFSVQGISDFLVEHKVIIASPPL
jgi:hypothetical protein